MSNSVKAGVVSTIVPVFNRPEMLRRAVLSVVNQTYELKEIIIVNDGSTDSTLSVANELQQTYESVQVISIDNSGPGTARESGRKIATGEFLQYLDSDDVLSPQKFEKQVAKLREEPDCGVCYCITKLQRTHEGENVEAWKRTGEVINSIIPSMLASRWWDTSTPLYRKTVSDKVGPWSNLINEEDWEYDCRVGFVDGRLAYVPEVLSIQIQHDLPRASDHGASDVKKLRSRAQARHTIIDLAAQHECAYSSDEFIIQLKYSLLLSRQCALAGLGNESKALFKLAAMHLKRRNRDRLKLYLYETGARLLGWTTMAKLSHQRDRLKS